MCNHYRLIDKPAGWTAAFDVEPPAPDGTCPVGDIFPTGKKTPAYGTVIVEEDGRRCCVAMEWGVPTQVPGKRDPATKLTKYVTNVRNLSSPFWRSMLTTPARRCLVPVTAFSEYGQERGEDGRLPLRWFDVPSRPVFAFAGIWRPTERGDAYAFLTTEPNALVKPIHPKAMPVILQEDDHGRWLRDPWDELADVVAPYPSQLMQVS